MTDIRNMIERILGAPLDDRFEHAITLLNDVPPALIDSARSLAPVLRLFFLRFHVAPSEYDYLPLFIEEVVDRGADPATWRKGRFLLPFPPVEKLVTLDTNSLLVSVGRDVSPADWKRMSVSPEAWRAGDTTSGAPGALCHDLDYHYSAPPDVLDFLLDRPLLLEDVGDLPVAVRRWMAACIARHFLRVGMETHGNAAELLATAFPNIQASSDAVIAAAALIRETSRYGEGGIPGFRGPDDWYVKKSS